MEDELAKELQMRKLENESKERFRQKIIQDSQEIQGLKKKIQVAQVNKERTRQMAEQQITKIEDKVFRAASHPTARHPGAINTAPHWRAAALASFLLIARAHTHAH